MKKPHIASADWERLRAHALAVLFVTGAIAAKLFLGISAEAASFVLLGAAVASSAALGGLSTGIVATLTGVVLARTIGHAPAAPSVLFAVEGFVISVVIVRLAATAEEYARDVDAVEARLRDLKVLERGRRSIDIACERLEQVAVDDAWVMLDPHGRISTWRTGSERQFGWPEGAIVGTSGAILFGLEPGDEAFKELLARASAGGIARWSGRMRRADRTAFEADIEVQLLAEAGCDGFTMLVHDRTREQAWQAFTASTADAQLALREEAEAAHRQLATLQHVTDPSLYALPAGDVAPALLDRLRQAVDADGVALVRGTGPRVHVVAASEGLQPAGAVVYRSETDRIADQRTLLIQNDSARVAEMSRAGWPEIVSSLIVVPVVYAGRVEGTIEGAGLRGRRSTEWEIAVIQVVAGRFAGRTLGEQYLRADAVA
jgi:PAS domain-containing protein